jgi:hypothetical protein
MKKEIVRASIERIGRNFEQLVGWEVGEGAYYQEGVSVRVGDHLVVPADSRSRFLRRNGFVLCQMFNPLTLPSHTELLERVLLDDIRGHANLGWHLSTSTCSHGGYKSRAWRDERLVVEVTSPSSQLARMMACACSLSSAQIDPQQFIGNETEVAVYYPAA